jgi:hypothetical protein
VVEETDSEDEVEEREDEDEKKMSDEVGSASGSVLLRLNDKQQRQLRRCGEHAAVLFERMYLYCYPAFHVAYEGSFFVFQWMFLFSPQLKSEVRIGAYTHTCDDPGG